MKKIYILLIFCMPYVVYSQVPQETLAVDEGFGKEIKIEVNNEPNTINLPPIKDRTAGPPPDETRIIHWVHGLKGNKTSWEKVAKVTEDVDEANTVDDWNARDVKSIRHEYRENHSLDDDAVQGYDLRYAAKDLREFIVKATEDANINNDPKNNFIIAHSQGGLVSNAMIANDNFGASEIGEDVIPVENQLYGGLVTFGSTMQGAAIFDGTEQLIENLHADCNIIGYALNRADIILTKSANLLFDGSPFGSIVGQINAEDFNEDIEEIIDLAKEALILTDDHCALGLDLIIETLQSQSAPITKGYEVDSPELANILSKVTDLANNLDDPSNDPKLVKVAFYGVEPQVDPQDGVEAMWSMFSWSEEVGFSPNSAPYFQAEDDSGLQITIDSFRLKVVKVKILAKQSIEKIESVISNFGAALWTAGLLGKVEDIQNDLALLENNIEDILWIFDNINDQWLISIGALSFYNANDYNSFCQCHGEVNLGNGQGMQPFNVSWQSGNAQGNSDCIQSLPIGLIDDGVNPNNVNFGEYSCNYSNQVTIIRNEKESDAVGLVESTSNMPDATVLPRAMLDSSHLQMRNDPNTKMALNDLFNGNVHEFFITYDKE